MGKPFVSKLLKEMLHEVDYDVVRSGLDKQKHLVTITVDKLADAYRDAYNKTAENNPRLPDPKGWKVFNTSAKAAVQMVKRECAKKSRTSLTEVAGTLNNPNQVTFYVTKGNHKIFKEIKREFTLRLNRKLKSTGTSRLTNAYDIKQSNPNLHWGAASRASEVGQINRGIEIHHKGFSTVGIAQLNKAFALLDSSKTFKGFLGEDNVRSLRDLFGDFDAVIQWDTELGDFVIKEGVEVEIGSYKDNFAASESTDWKLLKPKLLKAVNNWASEQNWYEMKGSNSLAQDSEASIAHDITKTLAKASNVTVISPSKKPKRNKSKVKTKSSGPSRRFKAGNRKSRRYKQINNTAPMNISFLMGILNQKLPEAVAANMNSPRLNYRTGRFAESVKVTDITRTPQGYPSVGYTYAKNPYQTFEPGFAQGSADRDPRKLIDRSIRDIAIELAIGRFYTRRV